MQLRGDYQLDCSSDLVLSACGCISVFQVFLTAISPFNTQVTSGLAILLLQRFLESLQLLLLL
jgi:hypothetical protein